MLAVSQTLTWQRVATKHHLIMARNPHVSFSLPVVKFLQHMYTYIYNPRHIFETKQILGFINLFSKPNQVFDSVDGRKSLTVVISLALLLFRLCYNFTFTKKILCFFSPHFLYLTIQTCNTM